MPTENATPAPEAKPAPTGDYSEPFAALDAITDGTPAPEAKPDAPPAAAPAPKAEEPKPVETPEPPAADLGDDLPKRPTKKAADAPKADAPPAEAADAKAPKWYRETIEKKQSELTAREARIKELEAAVAKAQDDGRKSAEAAYQAKLDKALQERDQYETELRYENYAKSAEYKEKFEAPLQAAYKAALEEIDGLEIEVSDGTKRAATPEDLWQVVNMPTAAARAKAAELFGPTAAADIMRSRAQIRNLMEARKTAQEEWRTKGSERAKEQAEERERAQSEFASMIDSRAKELSEAAPDIFGEPTDPEAKEFYSKAAMLVDVALGRAAFKEGIAPAEIVKMKARAQGDVIARARAFGPVVHQRNKLQAEVEALKAKLAEYEESEPQPGAKGEVTKQDDWEATLDKMADM